MIIIFKIKATGTKVWNALDDDLETLSKKHLIDLIEENLLLITY